MGLLDHSADHKKRNKIGWILKCRVSDNLYFWNLREY